MRERLRKEKAIALSFGILYSLGGAVSVSVSVQKKRFALQEKREAITLRCSDLMRSLKMR